MSWLKDKAWEDLNKVDTDPQWMRGRFGTIVYMIAGGLFLLFGLAAGIQLLVNGPAEKQPTTEQPAAQANSAATNSSGGF